MVVTPTDLGRDPSRHARCRPLVVNDEAYRGMWHSPEIQVLMDTALPLNDKPVVYVGPNPAPASSTFNSGHRDSTMHNPAYRKLVRNAILWGAGSQN